LFITYICQASEVYSIQDDVIKFISDLRQITGFIRVLRFSPLIKFNRHYITEILLKVAINTINLTRTLTVMQRQQFNEQIHIVSSNHQFGHDWVLIKVEMSFKKGKLKSWKRIYSGLIIVVYMCMAVGKSDFQVRKPINRCNSATCFCQFQRRKSWFLYV
jgi:hypothetical protein